MLCLRLFVLLLLGGLLPSPAGAGLAETGFLDRSLTLGGVEYRFQVFVPAQWRPDEKWPVILFLHGAGERGDDGLRPTEVGLGAAIRLHRQPFPAVAVFPQCRLGKWWTDPEMESVALAALAQAIEEFNGDPERIYLTGLSMGGYGAWNLAARHPGRFAALAPVCGGIAAPSRPNRPSEIPEFIPAVEDRENPYASVAGRIGRTPVWVFHGEADPVVPVEESRRMVLALRAAGGEARYSEFIGVGHDSWNRAYAEPEFFPWLFSKRLNAGR